MTTTMPKAKPNTRGYDSLVVERIRQADPSLPGVQLGLLCVEHNLPVGWVATRLKVSRVIVYRWFTGAQPRPAKLAEILLFTEQIRKRLK
jgi:hypothetical protein